MTSLPNWTDDVLGRGHYARQLQQYVLSRLSKSGPPELQSICIAVDGAWGAGKSFFVDRWRLDLEAEQFPVVGFDAWSNDLADDPLIGFISSLRKQLSPFVRQIDGSTKVKRGAVKALDNVIEKGSKAIVPVGKIVGAALFKKVFAADLGDVLDTLKGPDLAQKLGEELTSTEMVDAGSKAAKTFFEAVMKDHDDRHKAIREFRQALEELIRYLDEHGKTNWPLFIFVDELDRCRPDYAMRLLEGIKHLFEVKGTCFVVSTNISQLGESAKSIYGSGFDAQTYLKRFFAFEYQLPRPDHVQYANKLLSNSPLIGAKTHGGLPGDKPRHNKQDFRSIVVHNFAVVAQAFDLDLRSQRQVALYAEAAAVNKPYTLCFPLFFLAAVFHRSREAFERLLEMWNGKATLPASVLEPARFKDFQIEYKTREQNESVDRRITCYQIFCLYAEAAQKGDDAVVKELMRSDRSAVYPQVILQPIEREYELVQGKSTISLRDYPSLVQMAGAFRTT